MKRILIFLLAVMLCIPCVSCNKDDSTDGEGSVNELDVNAAAAEIIEKYSLTSGKSYDSLSQVEGEYLDEDLIRSYFGDATSMPDFEGVETYFVYIDETKPTLPCEFGIFKMKNGTDKKLFMEYLQARINLKIENAKSYPSTDTEPLTTAKFTEYNGYVWYCAVKGGNDDIDKTLKEKIGG